MFLVACLALVPMITGLTTLAQSAALFPKGQVVAWWYKSKEVLNNGAESTSGLTRSAISLVEDLRTQMLEIKSNAITNDGKNVDYVKIRESASFAKYKDLVQELKYVRLELLSTSEKRSMLINIYNCLVVHAIIDGLLDIKGGTVARVKLYASASYNIGGYLFSLNEIENGLLRRNRKSAVPLTFRPFRQESDPRRNLMLDVCDPRIHFALNCGAVGCPPIGVYSSDEKLLDEQLALASEGFLDQSVTLDSTNKRITLSMLFSWYREDFGSTDQDVIDWIAQHASPELKQKMVAFEKSLGGSTPKIAFDTYDWGLNGEL